VFDALDKCADVTRVEPDGTTKMNRTQLTAPDEALDSSRVYAEQASSLTRGQQRRGIDGGGSFGSFVAACRLVSRAQFVLRRSPG
jgi:hypothetical protein